MINNQESIMMNKMQLQFANLRPMLAAMVLICSTLTIIQCQDVDQLRASTEKSEPSLNNNVMRSPTITRGGVFNPRANYGHQIMHFGKRPTIPLPSNLYDVFRSQLREQQKQRQHWNQFQGLEPLDEDITSFEFSEPIQGRQPIYSIISPAAAQMEEANNAFRMIQANNARPTKFSRLISAADQFADSQSQDELDAASKSSDQQNAINVATRSPHSSGRVSGFSSGGKNYISTLLLGRASTPSMGANFGSFIKKAEPKDNVFMHFGRK